VSILSEVKAAAVATALVDIFKFLIKNKLPVCNLDPKFFMLVITVLDQQVLANVPTFKP
jgi:hypothetical protein